MRPGRPLHVRITEVSYQRLKLAARERSTSMSVIREAIDVAFPPEIASEARTVLESPMRGVGRSEV